MIWIAPYVTSIIFVVLMIIFGRFCAEEMIRSMPPWRRKLANLNRIKVLWVVAAIIVANGITLAASTVEAASHMFRTGSYKEAAESFGLHANEQYPLLIGGSAGSSTTGTAEATAGFFSATSFVDLKPTTTITLSFSHEGRSWITTIPTDLVTFRRLDDATPTVSVDLKATSYGDKSLWDNDKTNQIMIANGALTNVYWFTRPDISLSEQGQREGLAPVVNNGVTHVEVILPNSLYRKVFNLQEG